MQTGTYADMQALLQRGGYIYLLVRGFLHAEVDSEGSGVGGNRGVCNIDTTFQDLVGNLPSNKMALV